MVINEYPEIKQGGKTIVPKSSMHHVVQEFVSKISERNKTSFVFFIDKEKMEEIKKFEMEDELINPEDYPCGTCWSMDFTSGDMMTVMVQYMNTVMSKKERIAFVSHLQTQLLTQMVDDDEDEVGYSI